jgi:hypothetical protein
MGFDERGVDGLHLLLNTMLITEPRSGEHCKRLGLMFDSYD